MDIHGLILVDAKQATHQPPFARTPLAMVDVAGASPLERMAERLRQFGVSTVTILLEEAAYWNRILQLQGATFLSAAPERFWRRAESVFNELARKADLVVMIGLGAYAEIDFDKLVQFHLQGRCRVSQGACGAEPLQVFCLSASRRNDAASLLRSRLTRCRSECEFFSHSGYWNRLSSAHDLRQFCIDVLTMKTETRPAGLEIRPGIWTGPGAQVEKGSRILAPAFIGASARIRSGAVITRCTSVERHAQVDCGTIVENSTLLPYVYLGAGLDLAHSVAGTGHIANLRRSITVDVADAKLLGRVSFSRGWGLLSLAARLSARIRSGVFREAALPQPVALNGKIPPPVSATAVSDGGPETAGEFVSDLMVARRYGNQ